MIEFSYQDLADLAQPGRWIGTRLGFGWEPDHMDHIENAYDLNHVLDRRRAVNRRLANYNYILDNDDYLSPNHQELQRQTLMDNDIPIIVPCRPTRPTDQIQDGFVSNSVMQCLKSWENGLDKFMEIDNIPSELLRQYIQTADWKFEEFRAEIYDIRTDDWFRDVTCSGYTVDTSPQGNQISLDFAFSVILPRDFKFDFTEVRLLDNHGQCLGVQTVEFDDLARHEFIISALVEHN